MKHILGYLILALMLTACGPQPSTDPIPTPQCTIPVTPPGYVGDATNWHTVGHTPPTKVRISFHGDSIFRGYGMAQFEHPNPINSITRILGELIAKDIVEVRTGAQTAEGIWDEVTSGKVGDGDIAIFENAGPHFNDDDYYRTWIHMIHRALTWDSQSNREMTTKVYFSTMFSYSTDIRLYNSDYSTPVNGGLSINQVITDYGSTNGLPVFKWKDMMDAAKLAMPDIKFVHDDGIHPTVFGNLLMAYSIYYQLNLGPTPDNSGLKAQFESADKEMVDRHLIPASLMGQYPDIINRINDFVKTNGY